MQTIPISPTLELQLFCPENAQSYIDLLKANKCQLEDSFRESLLELNEYTFEEYVNFILKYQNVPYFQVWLLKSLEAQRFIGSVKVHSIRAGIGAGLAYFMDQKFLGKGYTTEAVKKMLAHCFETIELNKVFLKIIPDNVASIRIAEKTGFTQTGVIRKEILTYHGKLEDAAYFELLKTSN